MINALWTPILIFILVMLHRSICIAFNLNYVKTNAFHRLSMKSGGHGQNFKYLPLIQGSDDELFPRILKIAGAYPSLTPDELMSPISSPSPPVGSWVYEFTDLDGWGTVALPGSSVLNNAIDPVVMIATNTDLGVSIVEEVEVLVVVDRGDRGFSPDSFFVFKTPKNDLSIMWCDEIPKDYVIMGKVVVCAIPFTESMKSKSTGFMEDDE